MKNMYDKVMTEPTSQEEVMIVTAREVIEGLLYHNENVRLSDALNAETNQYDKYIRIKEASVYSVQTGKLIFQTNFLMISHQHIIYMTPRNCVVMKGEEAASGEIVIDRNGEPLEADKGAVVQAAAFPTPPPQASFKVKEKKTSHDDVHPVAVATSEPSTLAASISKDSHLLCRQAMLETLSAIRERKTGKSPEDDKR